MVYWKASRGVVAASVKLSPAFSAPESKPSLTPLLTSRSVGER
jgi:hypothetical protein